MWNFLLDDAKIRTAVSYVYRAFLFHDYVTGPVKPSGFSMHRQVTLQKFYNLPTECITCFVWVSEQTVIISR